MSAWAKIMGRVLLGLVVLAGVVMSETFLRLIMIAALGAVLVRAATTSSFLSSGWGKTSSFLSSGWRKTSSFLSSGWRLTRSFLSSGWGTTRSFLSREQGKTLAGVGALGLVVFVGAPMSDALLILTGCAVMFTVGPACEALYQRALDRVAQSTPPSKLAQIGAGMLAGAAMGLLLCSVPVVVFSHWDMLDRGVVLLAGLVLGTVFGALRARRPPDLHTPSP